MRCGVNGDSKHPVEDAAGFDLWGTYQSIPWGSYEEHPLRDDLAVVARFQNPSPGMERVDWR